MRRAVRLPSYFVESLCVSASFHLVLASPTRYDATRCVGMPRQIKWDHKYVGPHHNGANRLLSGQTTDTNLA